MELEDSIGRQRRRWDLVISIGVLLLLSAGVSAQSARAKLRAQRDQYMSLLTQLEEWIGRIGNPKPKKAGPFRAILNRQSETFEKQRAAVRTQLDRICLRLHRDVAGQKPDLDPSKAKEISRMLEDWKTGSILIAASVEQRGQIRESTALTDLRGDLKAVDALRFGGKWEAEAKLLEERIRGETDRRDTARLGAEGDFESGKLGSAIEQLKKAGLSKTKSPKELAAAIVSPFADDKREREKQWERAFEQAEALEKRAWKIYETACDVLIEWESASDEAQKSREYSSRFKEEFGALLEAFDLEAVGVGLSSEQPLRNWKKNRLRQLVETSLKRLLDLYGKQVNKFNKLDHWFRIEGSPLHVDCIALLSAYDSAANKIHALQALHADLDQKYQAGNRLGPNARKFPARWTTEMRKAWPRDHGPLSQMEKVERYDGRYWHLKDREEAMVLVRSEEGAPKEPFLIDKHEVTYKEFSRRYSKPQMKTRRTAALERWWRKYSRVVSGSDRPDEILVFGLSYANAKEFAAIAYPDLPLGLPTVEQWRRAFELEARRRFGEARLAEANFAKSAERFEGKKKGDLVQLPRVGSEDGVVLGLVSGVSEWCRPASARQLPSVIGISVYRPWTDLDQGLRSWGRSREREAYFKNGRREGKERPAHLHAAACGFRCVYDLKADGWGKQDELEKLEAPVKRGK